MNKKYVEEKTKSLKESKERLEKQVLNIRQKLAPYEDYSQIVSLLDEKNYKKAGLSLLELHYDGDICKRLEDPDFVSIVKNLENKTKKEIASTLQKRKPKVFISRQEVNAVETLDNLISEIDWYYKNILDSNYKEMDGDIIITDPGYLLSEEDDSSEFEEWEEKVKKLYDFCDTWGIRRNTIYGDWSCETQNTDSHEIIGRFCADGGEVVVIPLKKALKYNPDFNYHIEKPWTTTLIRDFHGKVRIIVNENKISSYDEYEVSVIGEGNINFKTSQSGL